MKFLLESRRGELFNKYMSEYDPQILNTVFNDEFSKRTNYKYVDWILSHLEFPTNPHALEVLELVKEFDRIGKNLEVKDLNQYPDIAELKGVIENYTSKSQDKKIEGEAVKVYEDNRVLIIKPLSHKASCKYGAGTKWCTTQSSPGYFDKYTSGRGQLFYLIFKGVDSSNKFYKIAIHKNGSEETWWDSVDNNMPHREVELIKVGLGKDVNTLIEKVYKSSIPDPLRDIFKNEYSTIYDGGQENWMKSIGKSLKIGFYNPTYFGEGDERTYLNIDYEVIVGNEKIEEGTCFLVIGEVSDNYIYVNGGGVEANDEFIAPVTIESLLNFTFPNLQISIMGNHYMEGPKKGLKIFEEFCGRIGAHMRRVILDDENFQKYLLKDKKIWRPNRFSYGFTFKRKGLINKLVDYIDSGNYGNAIDFLIDAKILKKEVTPDGEVKYIGKNGYIQPKGYFSSFFASAISAGIISYKRENKKYYLVKGPNFDDFKEGKLVAD